VRDHHLAGILRHFGLQRPIQVAKARAKGYRTDTNLITIAYLLCARLRHLPRNRLLHPTAQA
jgi:hypothetical protein